MATFLTGYAIGMVVCFLVVMLDESFAGNFQPPFLAMAVTASVLWPFFLALAVYVILQDWVEWRKDRVFDD